MAMAIKNVIRCYCDTYERIIIVRFKKKKKTFEKNLIRAGRVINIRVRRVVTLRNIKNKLLLKQKYDLTQSHSMVNLRVCVCVCERTG